MIVIVLCTFCMGIKASEVVLAEVCSDVGSSEASLCETALEKVIPQCEEELMCDKHGHYLCIYYHNDEIPREELSSISTLRVDYPNLILLRMYLPKYLINPKSGITEQNSVSHIDLKVARGKFMAKIRHPMKSLISMTKWIDSACREAKQRIEIPNPKDKVRRGDIKAFQAWSLVEEMLDLILKDERETLEASRRAIAGYQGGSEL